MHNFISYLEDYLADYESVKLFGIFLNGRRIKSITGKHTWESYANAKKALHYIINLYKKIDWNHKFYQEYNLTKEEVEKITVDELLANGVFEIREVGNT